MNLTSKMQNVGVDCGEKVLSGSYPIRECN